MPKMSKNGKVKKSELPDTLKKSPKKAQKTFAKAHDAAMKQYGEGERAHRTAFSALKHSYEKVGDHWEKKSKKGPSDAHAERGGRNPLPTAEGVDANATKAHLLDVAQPPRCPGRSTMNKASLSTQSSRRTGGRVPAPAESDVSTHPDCQMNAAELVEVMNSASTRGANALG